MSDRRVLAAFGIDVLAVLIFVAIGRRNHHEDGNAVVGALKIGAPFVIALVVGWLVTRARRAPMAVLTGVGVWVCTVVLGLALRRVVFDRGIAIAFIVVATITLGVFLVGWRAIARAGGWGSV
jgi:hypothetical protein